MARAARLLGVLLSMLGANACAGPGDEPVFSQLEIEPHVQDINHYGCEAEAPDKADIAHVLETGVPVTEADLHDRWSTTGCSVRGRVLKQGALEGFEFDFSGIVRFSDGSLLACGPACCADNFVFCGYTPEE